MLVLASQDSGYHPPSIAEFFPPALLFEGTPFQIDRIMLIRVLMTVLLVGFFLIALRRPKIVPRGVQNLAEMGLDFVRVSIAEEILGKVNGKRFLPLLTTIFFMVWALNLSGVIPFLNMPSTAKIGVPLVLALLTYVVFNYAGIKAQGFGPYMKSNLFPPGIPKPLYLLVTPIEFVSTFLVRPFTLTVRLLANMIAGHMTLVLFFGAAWFLLFQAGSLLLAPVGVLSFGAGFIFTLFELLVQVLQAYVFTMLTAVYIDGALHAEH
ncbi:F0F1 ATP synthase subunit A [Allokutzneria sp. A3M-2-11 16]|uniref:F0F1 ATP synthase subunit A n=1 Tax=Allokutzneria sp. A3M-2-11 16 TaxID=2962043 RepID=UPI0020B71254|nr:F0F1 ATP synthase subunit A [Allokutzneria sp. A3M-2-11 16]MCP3798264.1 F0F1 ATP synthase subunit A [Allokutzneria sp. A3M-2-11 16]